MSLRSLLSLSVVIAGLTGCSATTKITNTANTAPQQGAYSLEVTAQNLKQHNVAVLVSFSGGGTRAAALSYGVLKGMRDIEFSDKDGDYRLLDQITTISSVSGGSFTAAYYGLYNEEIFNQYEDDFLYRDVSGSLLDIALSPTFWFSKDSRTAAAVNFYNQALFKDATFNDMHDASPRIIINSTDLGGGVRFSFLQEYFDLICSDVNDYSIANAVAASSAVPIIFEPVVLQNYSQCDNSFTSISNAKNPIYLDSTRDGLVSYSNKDKRPYVHLVDGGISDNLGLLAVYDLVKSQESRFQNLNDNIDTVIVISVDASTNPDWNIDIKKSTPSAQSTLGAITDIQIHRYNDLVKSLVVKELNEWRNASSKREAYFIDINLNTAHESDDMNNIPTDFTLKPQQVEKLIQHGYDEIRSDPQLSELFQSTPMLTSEAI
ncbi:MAG: patatin-like phospholipase family protein [Aliivibrio sp.]|uniref:patatin-like phospholipase family protein n=1 Tax=Aliivibrio sp. TaxID=1872443 RepID=UPI001A4592FF|nr:patatin-like phospholipase family protein [Aliivibrio sp.]